ncbi:hypothetical protein I317_02686 [Kwoniella heveanensis CBS 569]|nr:hypothetical protein I317_02686 [Kwoniella heveanensis CBS 569]
MAAPLSPTIPSQPVHVSGATKGVVTMASPNTRFSTTCGSGSTPLSPPSTTIAAYHQSLAQHILAILRSSPTINHGNVRSDNVALSSTSAAPETTSRSRSRSPEASSSRRSTITALPRALSGCMASTATARPSSLIDPNVLITVVPAASSSSSAATQDMSVDGESIAEDSSCMSVDKTMATTEAASTRATRSVSSQAGTGIGTGTRGSSRQSGGERRGRSRTRSGPRVSLLRGKEGSRACDGLEKQEDYEVKREARLRKRRAELESTVTSWLEGVQGASNGPGDLWADSEDLPHLTAIPCAQEEEADDDRTPTALKMAERITKTIPDLSPLLSSMAGSSSIKTTDTGVDTSTASPYYYFTNTPRVTCAHPTSANIQLQRAQIPLQISVEEQQDRMCSGDAGVGADAESSSAVAGTEKSNAKAKMSSLTFSTKVCKASFRACKSPRLNRSHPRPQSQSQPETQTRAQPQSQGNDEAKHEEKTSQKDGDTYRKNKEEKEWLLNLLASDEWAASVASSANVNAQQQVQRNGISSEADSRTRSTSTSKTRKRSPMRVVVTGEMPTPRPVSVASFWG